MAPDDGDGLVEDRFPQGFEPSRSAVKLEIGVHPVRQKAPEESDYKQPHLDVVQIRFGGQAWTPPRNHGNRRPEDAEAEDENPGKQSTIEHHRGKRNQQYHLKHRVAHRIRVSLRNLIATIFLFHDIPHVVVKKEP